MRIAATAVGGAYLSLVYPGSWNEGLSSGQGLMAVALVIFARWQPLRCLAASLLFGAALQAIGVTGGYDLWNAAPYVLTLALMILHCRPDRRFAGAPGELSLTHALMRIVKESSPMNRHIEANPYPWPYDGALRPENTVLIVIDMQTDFCGHGGYVD